MRIPSADGDRAAFYERIARACMVSQNARRAQYERWKRYYMLGCSNVDDPNKTVNKIFPHVDQLTSFMYSQETTTFGIELGVSVSDLELAKVAPMVQLLNEEWANSDTDINFGVALLWSWVYGTMLLKPLWRRDCIQCGLVEPHNFGVLREDSPKLSSQEAFCHEYMITLSQLEEELMAAAGLGAMSGERVNEILKRVTPTATPGGGEASGPANIVVTTIQPLIAGNNMVGGINPDMQVYADYRPRVAEPLLKMRELYVWNNAERTFQVVSIADPYVPIWDRPLKGKMGIEGEPPFIQVAPAPALDYFWGHSEVERLIPLQDLRNMRLNQIRALMDRQADPPQDFSGYSVTDEIMAAFNTPGGRVSSDMPNSKVTDHSPQMPSDLFAEIDKIDSMFEEMSGVNNVLSGRGEVGVRSAGHASQLARLGSSRAKKRAMIVEDSLDNAATLYVKLLRKFCDRRMREQPVEEVKETMEFIAEQFPVDFRARVSAHSNSPVFMEDTRELVFNMLKARMIDRDQALALLEVPNKQLLRQILKKKIEPGEARAAAAQQKMQLVHGAGRVPKT